MNAFLSISCDDLSEEVPLTNVFEYISSQGIIFGLDRDAVIKIISEKKYDEKILIASGTEAIKGKDGHLEFLFETKPDKKPVIKENGSTDYYNIQTAQKVNKGDTLAVLHPPDEGVPGTDVLGRRIPSKSGSRITLFPGKNTSFKDDKKTILQADCEGTVKLVGKDTVTVDTIYLVKGDVDFNSGNVDVNGDAKIMGDVKAGFSIKATGDVFIDGVVEDATVEAGGDVVIKGGYVGKGEGVIKAGGQVIVNFVHNQKINAKGNIYINEEAIQGQINTEASLIMTNGKGVLMGGMVRVGKFIEVNELGNDQYISTLLFVADTPKQELLIKQLKNDIQTLNDKYAEAQKIIAKLLELKYQSGWKPDHETLYRQMEKCLVDIPENINQTETRLKELESEVMSIKNNAYIKIMDKVYSGIKMKIAGLPRKIENDVAGVIFKIIDNKVEAIPIV